MYNKLCLDPWKEKATVEIANKKNKNLIWWSIYVWTHEKKATMEIANKNLRWWSNFLWIDCLLLLVMATHHLFKIPQCTPPLKTLNISWYTYFLLSVNVALIPWIWWTPHFLSWHACADQGQHGWIHQQLHVVWSSQYLGFLFSWVLPGQTLKLNQNRQKI